MVEIITERLRLRCIEWTDLEDIHALHVLPETDEFNTLGIPQDIDETKTVIAPWISENQSENPNNYTFAIEGLRDKKLMGLFGLKLGSSKFKSAEIWYKFHFSYWRQGYATEAVTAVIQFGFETLQLHRIEAGCAVDNIGSIKVLEKVGMMREGHRRKKLPLKSGWTDNYDYAILETDYNAK